MKRKILNRALFQAYILNAIDGKGYGKELNTDKEKIDFLIETFKSEYWFLENQKYYKGNIYACFREWVMGLPSSFNCEFRNYKILELGVTFGLLDSESTEKAKDKFLESWFARVSFEVFRMHGKFNK